MRGAALSPAGDGVDVLDALGQVRLSPGATAVPRSEDLAVTGGAVDLIRVPGVQGHAHHGAAGGKAVIEARPGLAQVLTAVEGAVGAARGRAQTREEGARIVRGHAHVAPVGEGREP